MSLLYNRKNTTIIHDKRELNSRLKCLLGFRPGNLHLYEKAFIHRSATYTTPDGTKINNERLEYLGDAVLSIIVSEYLFLLFPGASEGYLTKARARIVNRDTLNQLAIAMKFKELVVSNVSSYDASRNLFGNALEALVGAVFIDKGYKKTKRFFIDKVLRVHLNINYILEAETDFKSLLLEFCQKFKYSVNFVSSEACDPETNKNIFNVSLELNEALFSTGKGNTKKEAEQEAAMNALAKLKSSE